MAPKRKRGTKAVTPCPTPFPWSELQCIALRFAISDIQKARGQNDDRWTVPKRRQGAATSIIKKHDLKMQSASRTTAMTPDKLVSLLKDFEQRLSLSAEFYRSGVDVLLEEHRDRLFPPKSKERALPLPKVPKEDLAEISSDQGVVEAQSQLPEADEQRLTASDDEESIVPAMAHTRSKASTNSDPVDTVPQTSEVSTRPDLVGADTPRKRRKVVEELEDPGSTLPGNSHQRKIETTAVLPQKDVSREQNKMPPAQAAPQGRRFFPDTTESFLDEDRIAKILTTIGTDIEALVLDGLNEDVYLGQARARIVIRGGSSLGRLYKGLLGSQKPTEVMTKVCKEVTCKRLMVAVISRYFLEEVFAAAPIVDGKHEVAHATKALGMLEADVQSQLKYFGTNTDALFRRAFSARVTEPGFQDEKVAWEAHRMAGNLVQMIIEHLSVQRKRSPEVTAEGKSPPSAFQVQTKWMRYLSRKLREALALVCELSATADKVTPRGRNLAKLSTRRRCRMRTVRKKVSY